MLFISKSDVFLIIPMKLNKTHSRERTPLETPKHHVPTRPLKNDLAEEFERFQHTIRQHEGKNEEMFHRIKDSYDFKKKEFAQKGDYGRMKLSGPNPFNYQSKETVEIDVKASLIPPMVKKANFMRQSAKIRPVFTQEDLMDKKDQCKSEVDKNDQDFNMQEQFGRDYGFREQRHTMGGLKKSKNGISQIRLSQGHGNGQNVYSTNMTAQGCTRMQQNNVIGSAIGSTPDMHFIQKERISLMNMVAILQRRCSEADARNKELNQYIKSKKHLDGKNGLVQAKPLLNNVKYIIENMFFSINEEYLTDKFMDIQRYVKKLQTKLKRLEYQLINYKQERNERIMIRETLKKRQSSKNARKRYSSQCFADTQIPPRTAATTSEIQHSLEDINQPDRAHGLKSTLEKLQEQNNKIKKQYEKAKKTISLDQNEKNELKKLYESMINENNQQHNASIKRVHEHVQHEKKVYERKIKELQQNIEGLKKKCQLTNKYKDDLQEIKMKHYKLNEYYEKQVQDTIKIENELKSIKQKLIQKEMEVHSLNTRMKAIQLQRNAADQKRRKSTGQTNLLDDMPQRHHSNSKIELDFKESFSTILGDNNHKLIQKEGKYIGQHHKQAKIEKKILNDQESNELLQAKMLLEEQLKTSNQNLDSGKLKENELAKEIEDLKIKNESYEKDLQACRRKMTRSSEEYEALQQKYEEVVNQLSAMQRQFKINNYKLLISERALGANSVHSIEANNAQDAESFTVQGAGKQLKFNLQELENEVQILMFDEQMEKQDTTQKIKKLEKDLRQKQVLLQHAHQELEDLRQQIKLVRSNHNSGSKKGSRESFLDIMKKKSSSLQSGKRSKIPSSDMKDDHIYRDSLSFRLSLDPDPNDLFSRGREDDTERMIFFQEDDTLFENLRQGKSTQEEQMRLFERTTAYIQTLKETILEKTIKIKNLEKEMKRLTVVTFRDGPSVILENLVEDRSDLRRSQSFEDANLSNMINGDNENQEDKPNELYGSASFNSKKTVNNVPNKRQKVEKEFLAEQNRMLLKDIQILQRQLSKAEKQETGLIKMKDMYKEQLKKQDDYFRNKFSSMQEHIKDVKTLFYQIVSFKSTEIPQGKEIIQIKRSEIQQSVKQMCRLLEIQTPLKSAFLSGGDK